MNGTEVIVAEIKATGGWIPFARFMELALYHPETGYYTRQISTVGTGGDFITRPSMGPELSARLARWVVERKGMDSIRHIIEIGAGTGVLARDLWKNLSWWQRRNLTYHLVEISQPLRQKQKETLRGHRVIWHESVTEALKATGGNALLLANELVDAFPCQIWRWEHEWRERGVVWRNNHFAFADCVTDRKPEQPWPDVKPGQMTEEFSSFTPWLDAWLPLWKKGHFLLLDYGDVFPDVIHRRPLGTLRSYFHQERREGEAVLELPGRQDLTADVNFSLLRHWFTQRRLSIITDQRQSEWLQTSTNNRMKNADDAFRVLEASR
jgi:SAM-dependent MidA family methyltransferase